MEVNDSDLLTDLFYCVRDFVLQKKPNVRSKYKQQTDFWLLDAGYPFVYLSGGG